MAIGTDAGVLFFGTQDAVHSGTPASIADGAVGKADQGGSVNWTNDDDAPEAAAVLKLKFTTNPTAGNVLLLAHLKDVQSTNDTPAPTATNFESMIVGAFKLSYSTSPVGNDTFYYTTIENFRLPMVGSGQAIDWYLKNNGTGQTIAASWELYITPKTVGPHA